MRLVGHRLVVDVQQAGAQKGFLLLARNDGLRIAAEARLGPNEIQVLLEDRELGRRARACDRRQGATA